MKKFTTVVIAVLLAICVLAACAPDQAPAHSGVHPETLKAIIERVDENSLLVQPLEGLDGIDVIYLNFNDDTVMNVSDNAPLAPGTVIYAAIGDAIMESYPPQVHLIELLRTEIDETITMTPIMDLPAADPPTENSQLMDDDYIIGKVQSISYDQYTVEITDSNQYSGSIVILIDPALMLDGAPDIIPGCVIGVRVQSGSGVIVAKEITFVEPTASQVPKEGYVTGKVLSLQGENCTLDVIDSEVFDGEIFIILPTYLQQEEVPPVKEGNIIRVDVIYEAMNYTAIEIVFNERDEIIQLDNRETVSGYLGGVFPTAVYSFEQNVIVAQTNEVFAVCLEENCESYWELVAQDPVVLDAQGTSQPRENGYYDRYFGLHFTASGEYTLTFVQYTADGEYEFSFDVTVP